MIGRFHILIFIALFSFSSVQAGHEDINDFTDRVAFDIGETNTLKTFEFQSFQSEPNNAHLKSIRKQRRIQAGENIIEIGFRTLEYADDSYCCTLIVTAPVLIVGSGILLWGVLTKDPTKSKWRR